MSHTDFYEAYQYLENHKYFQHPQYEKVSVFGKNTDIMVVKVNPVTKEISEDVHTNTETAVWLETGNSFINTDPMMGRIGEMGTHDYLLDCGGSTYEEAIIQMANQLDETYPELKELT